MATVWLDATRCTGCGACVEVCPTGALTLREGKAYLDAVLCRGCAVCLPVCPAAALRPVLEVEAVPSASPAPLSAPQVALPSQRPGLLARVVAAGAQLALQAAPLILQSLGQWLTRSRGGNLAQSVRPLGGGRQIRLRRRGRW